MRVLQWVLPGLMVVALAGVLAWARWSGETVTFGAGPIQFSVVPTEPAAVKNCREMRAASEATKHGISEQISQAQKGAVALQQSVDAGIARELQAIEADKAAAAARSDDMDDVLHRGATIGPREWAVTEEIKHVRGLQRDLQQTAEDALRRFASVDEQVSATCKNLARQ